MAVEAIFFDGETAHDRAVMVERVGTELQFKGDATPLTRWSIAGLHPIDPPSPGQPFRLTHDMQRGSRLVLRDEAFIAELIASNRMLKGGYSMSHLGQVLGWTAAGLAAAAGLVWLALSYLPQETAHLLPDSWRNRAGEQVVASLVSDSRKCETPEATDAWSAMVGALAAANADLPPVSIVVYDIPVTNAFAAPGGRILFTRKLLSEAESPDEVAGILAHEMGHVAHLHPEAQMIRLSGLQVLLSAISGGGSGEWAGNVAALAAVFQYSRDAEREADDFARATLAAASVDPMGLRHFFERMLEADKRATGTDSAASANPPSTLEKLGSMFSTHPGAEERIRNIGPLPAGQTPVKIMTDAQWRSLKAICG
jgi:Zn-dependent protease with chaperone function